VDGGFPCANARADVSSRRSVRSVAPWLAARVKVA